ncbi:hypothetical protein HELRODRAFT_177356 [Helobdella robusta]|uniref:Uncharacterized protein n=1 Tax=Helobdella robusta TaxID=6412 RepID=T1FBK2_HELRO|nr:hypothetical protein HELRODRAFT_177356 [Helobdella robusta]ESN98118.1 hypothetical protein HELRODRAFT_177356 [Helobdella robusta]
MVSEDHTEQHRILCRLPQAAEDCSRPANVTRKKRALSNIKIPDVINKLRNQSSFRNKVSTRNITGILKNTQYILHNKIKVMVHSLARKPHVLEEVSVDDWKKHGVDYVKLKSGLPSSDHNIIRIDAFWVKYSRIDPKLLRRFFKN